MATPAFKVGQKVTGRNSSGIVSSGKVADIVTTKSGAWIDVNVAPPRKAPQLKRYRPGSVTRV